jgi:hypothetical protein
MKKKLSGDELANYLQSIDFDFQVPNLPTIKACLAEESGHLLPPEKILRRLFLTTKEPAFQTVLNLCLEKRLPALFGQEYFFNGDKIVIINNQACLACRRRNICRLRP